MQKSDEKTKMSFNKKLPTPEILRAPDFSFYNYQ